MYVGGDESKTPDIERLSVLCFVHPFVLHVQFLHESMMIQNFDKFDLMRPFVLEAFIKLLCEVLHGFLMSVGETSSNDVHKQHCRGKTLKIKITEHSKSG